VTGSTAFCLYEVPSDEPGKRRWINLGIVQYVEATRTELRIYFGGGSLGSGHEAKIPFASMEEAAAIMEKLRKTAAACR
jgi:ribosome-associated translation inhibitor RaiA